MEPLHIARQGKVATKCCLHIHMQLIVARMQYNMVMAVLQARQGCDSTQQATALLAAHRIPMCLRLLLQFATQPSQFSMQIFDLPGLHLTGLGCCLCSLLRLLVLVHCQLLLLCSLSQLVKYPLACTQKSVQRTIQETVCCKIHR